LIAKARTKTIAGEESSWWGSYSWPTPVYPRFQHLHTLENLADRVSLLKSAMAHLGKTHELGLSIDSGHGWLNGPDISDMALFKLRCGKASKVFGKNLQAEDKQKLAIQAKLFEAAQTATLDECIRVLQAYNRLFRPSDVAFLRSVIVRAINSFKHAPDQPDLDVEAHTGGTAPTQDGVANGVQQPQPGLFNMAPPGFPPLQPLAGQNLHIPHLNAQAQNNAFLQPLLGAPPAIPAQNGIAGSNPLHPIHANGGQYARVRDRHQTAAVARFKQRRTTQPQYPIIFNGCNLAAEIGGWCHFIQRKVAPPNSFPLQPGTLTEAQAQWLMETAWAQRAFLSAYTTSILANRACFDQVHSMHIAKISSGLLPSLEQKELWQGLPGLVNLMVLVSPDWRIEHVTGDQTFNTNMLVSPVDASLQLAKFLKTYIAPLERLSSLTIGFTDGGEHATGIMARNQHVLPAPVTSAPRTWLSNHITAPDPATVLTFNHIKHLTIQNAWFSPLMLEAFMTKSQDSSLRTLTLDSISLTSTHSQRLTTPLTTATESLDPVHPEHMWLHETLPSTQCWPAIIDRNTPGATFIDRKYDAGMIEDPHTNPKPPPSFRGFVARFVFKSCGYVRLSGVSPQELNQNDLIYPNNDPMDDGMRMRAAALAEKGVMLSDKNPATGAEWPLLGRLTQCIHPVEKRVLEQAWGMKFGWGDDLERWAAVEDGCFEGGTGRFTGVIVGQGGKGIDGEAE
jgi:hypothetical protein